MARPRIGFLIIGDEILSGRTAEKNLAALAALLAEKGLAVDEARIVRDAPSAIAAALRQMRAASDYVFTSGGIGPTHDDMTADGAALAFGVAAEENKEAVAVLSEFCARRSLEFTAARRQMARAPAGAAILKSRFPGAPGFVMENVFICAGVPAIFLLMAEAACAVLPDYPRNYSFVLRTECPESELAAALADVQRCHPEMQIGSYPREEGGEYFCRLVFCGEKESAAAAAMREMKDFFARRGFVCAEEE